ncbi:MAG TPA: DUF501 domain-containing protein [Actinomycetota bacterium]|nr:DUF501 domain-containing protein [Actinomycetota bacterium]
MARRCHLGVPMVIENHPVLEDGSPFPTLYWLTCPVLVKRASKLESEGWMSSLNERLESDDGLKERLGEAVLAYARARDAHVSLEPAPAPPGGGPDRVKCLHAHTAHQLVTQNPVGALVLSQAGFPDCRLPCVDRPGRTNG